MRQRLLRHAGWLAAVLLSNPAAADTVHMAFGDNLPPYILVQQDAGIEIDIVREALAWRGHVLEAHYMPMPRLPVEFVSGRVDAIMIDMGEDMTKHGGHYGAPPVLYDNVFYTLKERAIAIDSPKDIKDLRIISFAGAARRYPGWFGKLDHSSGYVERNDQSVQPMLLAMGRYDAALSDRTIFEYNLKQLATEQPVLAAKVLEVHPFVNVNPHNYRTVFRSARVRNDFNAGLAELHRSGRYRAIYEKYLKR
ncbi:MAG TPA: ABC transporter substrate-binding protein [Telluria sp.]